MPRCCWQMLLALHAERLLSVLLTELSLSPHLQGAENLRRMLKRCHKKVIATSKCQIHLGTGSSGVQRAAQRMKRGPTLCVADLQVILDAFKVFLTLCILKMFLPARAVVVILQDSLQISAKTSTSQPFCKSFSSNRQDNKCRYDIASHLLCVRPHLHLLKGPTAALLRHCDAMKSLVRETKEHRDAQRYMSRKKIKTCNCPIQISRTPMDMRKYRQDRHRRALHQDLTCLRSDRADLQYNTHMNNLHCPI